MTGKVRIGLSGWNYDHWKGAFYPDEVPRSRWLEYIGEQFDTAEINGSFYSLQKPSSYRSWYDATPARFRFAVKGGRFITHNKKLSDVEGPLANFMASGVLALADKMGPILWQLPARHRFDRERLTRFLDLLPKDQESMAVLARKHDHRVKDPYVRTGSNHRVRHVLEARDESFFTEEAVRVLRAAGVALAVSHAADWPMREELTAGFVYIRLHGAPRTYESGYGDRSLERWAEKVRAWTRGETAEAAKRITDSAPARRKGRDVYVYFDNDARARAPRDATGLRQLLS